MLEQILQSLLIIVVIGLMLLVLYQIVKVSGALFLIGFISGLVFIEIYGIYLFFTERYLYSEDLATNGVWSFTGFFIIFNILLVLGLMVNIVKSRITEYKQGYLTLGSLLFLYTFNQVQIDEIGLQELSISFCLDCDTWVYI